MIAEQKRDPSISVIKGEGQTELQKSIQIASFDVKASKSGGKLASDLLRGELDDFP